jgi:hypothetical protein
VEATATYNSDLLDAWLSYAKTRQHETSLALLVRTPPGLSLEEVAQLRRRHIGLYSFGDSGEIEELIAPMDLAVNIQMPSLSGIKNPYKKLLQPCFQKIERGEWVDGFRDACQVLEAIARNVLIDGMKRGRVFFKGKKGKTISRSVSDVKKMPQGALARAYLEIANPTQIDIVLGKALKRVNAERITAVHGAHRARNDAQVRTKTGQHLWTIVSALKQL